VVQQITEGVRISVQYNFECSYFDCNGLRFGFNYFIDIENNNPHPIKLISRKWTILDALNEIEIVKGEGVVGKQPIIQPFQSYHYNSGCTLQGPIGSMKGVYNMVRLSDNQEFEVTIPNLRLFADFAQN
tara:strand:- start:524 stop:910 length:387 start_codon:yes stop_codon:yes gene_type:complete